MLTPTAQSLYKLVSNVLPRQNKLIRFLIILQLACLSACGFQLRQGIRLPEGVTRMQPVGLDALNPIMVELERELRANDVLGDDSSPRLVVLSESVNREVLSVNDNARVSEFVLVARASAKLVQGTAEDEKELLAPFEITTRREYSFDEAQALGAAQEEDIIRQELRKELVQLILLRLGRR
jgi:LPS-assembly lipoprotein